MDYFGIKFVGSAASKACPAMCGGEEQVFHPMFVRMGDLRRKFKLADLRLSTCQWLRNGQK
jgi:hypothetical protein